jgi:predicted Rossmann fold nucleotide-binding protein DprA/Smf involved in DNA uptake
MDYLGREEVGQDDIIRATGLGASNVATALLMLEMKRQIKSLPGRKVRKMG